MGKKLLFLTILSVMFVVFAKQVHAELVAGNSAIMYYTASSSKAYTESQELYIKKKAIKSLLEKRNAPLSAHVDSFMQACQQYDLDCYLLPAISGVESSFGQFIAPGSNNPFGWGRGLIPFETFGDSIMTVGKGLRENYINKGATSVEEIGSIYCEGNTWAGKVNYFMRLLQEEEKNLLFLSSNTVQL